MNMMVYGAGLASYPAGVHMHVGLYHSNLRAAINLTCADDGMPYGSLTVNLPSVDLADDEILVTADWNLAPDLKQAFLNTGKFVETGRWTEACHGRGALWRIACPDLLASLSTARSFVPRRRQQRQPAHA
ncbi:hypothetical protein [Cupriavidus basilensis]|uniref:hypothetical protein n=1 Tax=Cupriavidus basilensis TaxID=68895 RepID=UPI000750A98C|nr:hypothetical protein [Cupriavidus basilensis]